MRVALDGVDEKCDFYRSFCEVFVSCSTSEQGLKKKYDTSVFDSDLIHTVLKGKIS